MAAVAAAAAVAGSTRGHACSKASIDERLPSPRDNSALLSASRLNSLEQPACEPDDAGYRLQLPALDIEKINLRVLGHSQASLEEPTRRFIIPRVKPLEVLFFREIFSRLRKQLVKQQPSLVLQEENIPLEEFQRVFERLFVVLEDPHVFNAKIYDENGNGFVGWGEFFYVFKRHKIAFNMSCWERIFLTFDNPDSSILAQLVSFLVLLTIVTSSMCFILSTVPGCRTDPVDNSEPAPFPIFNTIELSCLVVFVVEYAVRLLTSWAVRAEVFDQEKLMELILGYNELQLPALPFILLWCPFKLPKPFVRLVKFMTLPANLVDLAAILPGLIGIASTQVNGGGFVVLRLIRLTRVFRVIKAMRGPAMVIGRTLQQSTPALYLLAFNLLLGIVIAGSLMYLVEGGKWDSNLKAYVREIGRTWNFDLNKWEHEKGESPFVSIPHAFWWAVVTATTVGYGDQYPTTVVGYLVAVGTMIFSLVILALPVGVIGGTFSQVWDEFLQEKNSAALARKKEMEEITSAMQLIDPCMMSRLIMVEVWNDRFAKCTPKIAWNDDEELKPVARPLHSEFLGMALVELALCHSTPVRKVITAPLREDLELVERRITGNVTLQYEWLPDVDEEGEGEVMHSITGDTFKPLNGVLRVGLLSASSLVGLNLQETTPCSNPYCTVLCYPSSPRGTASIMPVMWRGPTRIGTCSPQWNVQHVFHFAWTRPKWTDDDEDEEDSVKALREFNAGVCRLQKRIESLDSQAAGSLEKLDTVVDVLVDLNRRMRLMEQSGSLKRNPSRKPSENGVVSDAVPGVASCVLPGTD